MIERMKQVVAQLLSTLARTGMGNVYDYDPNIYAVRVKLQPSGEITGWVPLGTQWCGNGYGLAIGPAIGDLVRVDFVNWQQEASLVGARYFSDEAAPPAVPSGEMWAVHSSGAFLKLTNDGKATLNDKGGSTVALNGDGTGACTFSGGFTVNANTQINGNLLVSGDVTDNSAINASTMSHMRSQYDVHDHADAQGGTTGAPSNSM